MVDADLQAGIRIHLLDLAVQLLAVWALGIHGHVLQLNRVHVAAREELGFDAYELDSRGIRLVVPVDFGGFPRRLTLNLRLGGALRVVEKLSEGAALCRAQYHDA